jgi:hypothetical protein
LRVDFVSHNEPKMSKDQFQVGDLVTLPGWCLAPGESPIGLVSAMDAIGAYMFCKVLWLRADSEIEAILHWPTCDLLAVKIP